ncbi:hypothetical protein AADZ86_02905 [Colwelliaceae bacterium BS250]
MQNQTTNKPPSTPYKLIFFWLLMSSYMIWFLLIDLKNAILNGKIIQLGSSALIHQNEHLIMFLSVCLLKTIMLIGLVYFCFHQTKSILTVINKLKINF